MDSPRIVSMRLGIAAIVLMCSLVNAQSQEPTLKGLIRPAQFDLEARTIVFVHGLGSNCQSTFADFIAKCRVEGIQALPFEYLNHGPIGESGKGLAAALRELSTDFPQTKVVIVAHSMGGLVARSALEITNPSPSSVTDLFTIATPHEGSLLAEYGHVLRLGEGMLTLTAPRAFLGNGLGEACRDMRPGSALLRDLRDAKPAASLKYHVINGSRGLFAEEAWTRQVKEFRRIGEERLSWSPDEADRIVKALSQLDEVVHGKGDGAVAIRRAKLAAATSERTFDLGHLELTRGPGHEAVWAHILETLKWQK